MFGWGEILYGWIRLKYECLLSISCYEIFCSDQKGNNVRYCLISKRIFKNVSHLREQLQIKADWVSVPQSPLIPAYQSINWILNVQMILQILFE